MSFNGKLYSSSFPGGSPPLFHDSDNYDAYYESSTEEISPEKLMETVLYDDDWESEDKRKLALKEIWKMLEQNRSAESEQEPRNEGSWEMVVIQAILLVSLILISLFWACCCRKRCFSAADSLDSFSGSMVALARKLSSASKDLPPSYSKVDLRCVGLTIEDHLSPPPSYDWALEDTLDYCNPPPSPTPGHPRRYSRFSTSSRSSSISELSRRSSKVTFAPDLEIGPTPSIYRGDSSKSLPIQSALVHPSRRKSVKSEGYNSACGSRKGSAVGEGIYRKRNSIVEISPELEEELKLRLAFLDRNYEGFMPMIDGIQEEDMEEIDLNEEGPPTTTVLQIINEEKSE